ncbi:MAG: T9SS type A sorting domain-containing protein [Candidatus Zixiibacteriota bacterium]|nr:MAG: T9SS type A sorting domain-containing protein [candidate division Zixibacteria bacterium]
MRCSKSPTRLNPWVAALGLLLLALLLHQSSLGQMNFTVGDGVFLDNAGYVFSPLKWHYGTGTQAEKYFRFHVCSPPKGWSGVACGQQYVYQEYIEWNAPDPLPAVCTVDRFREIIQAHDQDLGVLMITTHADGYNLGVEAYGWSAEGLEARDQKFDQYLATYDPGEIEKIDLDGIARMIAVTPAFIGNYGPYGLNGSLVYINAYGGGELAQVFVNAGARVAVGPDHYFPWNILDGWAIHFFARLDGHGPFIPSDEVLFHRIVGNAILGLDLKIAGASNTTLSPAVDAFYAPCPIFEGDYVDIHFDSYVELFPVPDIVGGGGVVIEGEHWVVPGEALRGYCVDAPLAVDSTDFIYSISIPWQDVKSQANDSYLCDAGVGPSKQDFFAGEECHIGECYPFLFGVDGVYSPVLPGGVTDISIFTSDHSNGFGGFNFLLGYDPSALTPTSVTPGQLLEDCGWEYFTFRLGAQGNCGDGCPSGLLRIIALADMNDGGNHPVCFGPPDKDRYELAVITFFVTSNYNYSGQFVPIWFFWDDCGDNSVSSVNGDTLYIDRAIYDYMGNLIWDEDDDYQFPEEARIPNVGAPDYCLNSDPDKPSAVRYVVFENGGIRIIHLDSIDARGDVNLNGVPNEIADVVVFTEYFIYNVAAFTINPAGQIAATDVNADGIPLTVADLTYLIRIIIGDAMPYWKMTPASQTAEVNLSVDRSAVEVLVNHDKDIGGAYFVFEYSDCQLGEPKLINSASGMKLEYGNENGTMKVLIYSMNPGKSISPGKGGILAIPIFGNGSVRLTESQLSDYYGNILTVGTSSGQILPDHFVLHQNYPNPFNASTRILFELPEATYVLLGVFNSMGQNVKTLVNKHLDAGVHEIQWDGTDQAGNEVATGIYFIRLESGDFIQTRKMMLLR